jgi:L-asparaginase II
LEPKPADATARSERLRIEVHARRGPIVESRHRIQFAVCDAEGSLRAGSSEPGLVTTFRSAAKPFQLLPLVERGHAGRWGWTDEQLAVMCASHTGSAAHVALVTGVLEQMGLTERALACGYHEPLDPDSRARLRANPAARSAVYNNCSGKHAGMLCLALSEGWPLEGYERAEHPVQALMRDTVAAVAGVPAAGLEVAVDGCSVSVFGLPLAGMARAYARLATAVPEGGARDRALARIRGAMQAYPWAVGGRGRLSTALMEADPAGIVAKGGAEGLECAGLVGPGLGVALKCEDGHSRAVGPALAALLERLGALPEGSPFAGQWRRHVTRNHAGLEVGALEADVCALDPAAH